MARKFDAFVAKPFDRLRINSTPLPKPILLTSNTHVKGTACITALLYAPWHPYTRQYLPITPCW